MMMLFLILIGAVIYYIVANKESCTAEEAKPLDKLKNRYISGEIDEETYIKIKKIIKK